MKAFQLQVTLNEEHTFLEGNQDSWLPPPQNQHSRACSLLRRSSRPPLARHHEMGNHEMGNHTINHTINHTSGHIRAQMYRLARDSLHLFIAVASLEWS